jgi:hypothetical protein
VAPSLSLRPLLRFLDCLGFYLLLSLLVQLSSSKSSGVNYICFFAPLLSNFAVLCRSSWPANYILLFPCVLCRSVASCPRDSGKCYVERYLRICFYTVGSLIFFDPYLLRTFPWLDTDCLEFHVLLWHSHYWWLHIIRFLVQCAYVVTSSKSCYFACVLCRSSIPCPWDYEVCHDERRLRICFCTIGAVFLFRVNVTMSGEFVSLPVL